MEVQFDLFTDVVAVGNHQYYKGVLIEEIPPSDPREAIKKVRESERARKLSVMAVKELDEL